jgi:hypothetical protein
MPLRLTLSPLQRDIVTMLEEAGADSRYSQRNAETFRSVRVRLRDCQTGEPRFDTQEGENNLVLTEQGRIDLRR